MTTHDVATSGPPDIGAPLILTPSPWRPLDIETTDWHTIEEDAIVVYCRCGWVGGSPRMTLGMTDAAFADDEPNEEATCRGCGKVYRLVWHLEVRDGR